jgi:septation ring formation regulator EzrA
VTLLERARALDSVLRSAVDQDRLRLEIGRIDDRAAAIRTAAVELERAATAVEELRAAGRPLADETRQALSRLQQRLESARGEIASTPLVGAGDDLHAVVQAATDQARRTSLALTEAWARHLAELSIPSVDEEFLVLIETAGLQVDDLLRDVESARARITVRQGRRLPERGDVEALQHAIATLQGAVEALGSLVPAVVGDFIVQASSRTGAPLELLTEDVRNFLDEHGLTSRYRISQGRR